MKGFVQELLNNSDIIGLSFIFLLIIKIFYDIICCCCCGRIERKKKLSKAELRLSKQNELLEKELMKRKSGTPTSLIDDLNEIIESDQRSVKKLAMIKQVLLKY
jgi:hypothetical protein